MYNSTGGGTVPPDAEYRLPRSQGIAYISASVVEFVLIIIGNLVVLLVFRGNRQLRHRKSHWLLIHQSVIDLLAGVIIGPFWVYYLAITSDLWDYYIDVYLYIAVDSVFLLFVFASLFNLSMIALERMFATLCPIKHRTLYSRNYRVAIGLAWFLPVFLICLSAAERLNQVSPHTYFNILMSSTCCIFLLIVLSYTSIWIKLRCFGQPHNNLRAAQERKLTASLFLVTVVSLLTYVPGTVLSSLLGLSSIKASMSGYSAAHATNYAGLLVYANFMVNPILYSFQMPQFRLAAFRLFYRCHHTENREQALERLQHNRANFQARPATLQ